MSMRFLFLCCVFLPGSGDLGGGAHAAICHLQPPIASNQSCRGGVTLGSRSGSFNFSLEVQWHAEREEVALVKPSECDTSASTLNDCDQSADTFGKALREEILYFLNRTRWRVIKAEAQKNRRTKNTQPPFFRYISWNQRCSPLKKKL